MRLLRDLLRGTDIQCEENRMNTGFGVARKESNLQATGQESARVEIHPIQGLF